jgi:hypothetical protein
MWFFSSDFSTDEKSFIAQGLRDRSENPFVPQGKRLQRIARTKVDIVLSLKPQKKPAGRSRGLDLLCEK